MVEILFFGAQGDFRPVSKHPRRRLTGPCAGLLVVFLGHSLPKSRHELSHLQTSSASKDSLNKALN